MIKNKFFSTVKFILLTSFILVACVATAPQGPTSTISSVKLTETTHALTATTNPPSLEATPTPVTPVRFAVIGDYGRAGDDLAAVAELIDSWQVDFIITTGDNNYPDGAPDTIDKNIGQYFHSYIYPYTGKYGEGADTNRFFPSLGNHDWKWPDAQAYLDYFTLPGNERYYEFEWDFVHLFAVDSNSDDPDGNRPDSDQAEWLKRELRASTAPWQIVYFHHAPYSSGHHGPYEKMQWDFDAWGTDLVISGHDHTYERLEVDGLIYLVQGLSGASRYPFINILPESQMRYRGDFGALLVEVVPERLDFAFYNIRGELIDQYSLTKPET